MLPLRSAKMKRAGLPSDMTKDAVGLKTWPVGPGKPVPVGGIETVSPSLLTPADVTELSVLTFVPWSEAQKGLVVPSETPQGFLRLGSMTSAGTEPSETRLVCL